MANRKRNRELYGEFVAAFKELGPNFTLVAERLACDRQTAKRVYHYGWERESPVGTGPKKLQGCGPIKDLLGAQQIAIRAARVDEALAVVADGELSPAEQHLMKAKEQADAILADAQKRLAEVEVLATARLNDAETVRQAKLANADIEARRRLSELLAKAKVDGAETMADEATATKFGRKAAMGAAAVAALMLQDARGLVQNLSCTPEELKLLPPWQRLRYAFALMKLVEAAEKSVVLALQSERLRVGEPTEVVGIQTLGGEVDEVDVKLKAVLAAREKRRQHAEELARGSAESGEAAVVPGVASGPPTVN